MVQDTLQPEIYASTVSVEGKTQLGGWSLSDSLEFEDDNPEIMDYSKLKDRMVYWAVSVVGESKWVDEVSTWFII
jgi:hypothetical protein